jgi:hypothetical protein
MAENEPKPKTMRNHWFEHVRKIRKKMSKGQPQLSSHRDAMKKASETWPDLKVKLKKKLAREKKRVDKDKILL